MAFTLRRARTHLGRLVAIAIVGLLAVLSIGLGEAITDSGLDRGAALILDRAAPEAQTLSVQILRVPGAEKQAQAVEDAIHHATSGAEVSIVEQTFTQEPSGSHTVVLLSDADISQRAALDAGAWPTAAGEVAPTTAALNALGAHIGDEIPIGPVSARIVGSWTPTDPASWEWSSTPGVGGTVDAIGPLVITDADMAKMDSTPQTRWNIRPTRFDTAAVTADQRMIEELRGIPDSADPQRQVSAAIEVGIAATAARIVAATATARGVLLVPQVVVVVLAALVIGLLVAGMSRARQDELVLMRARGAAGGELGRHAAVESALAVLVGGVVACAVILATGGDVLVGAAIGVLLAAVAASVAVVATLRDSAQIARRRADSGLLVAGALVLPFLLAAGVAGLALAQLFSDGSFVVGGRFDVLAASAPALALVAGSFAAPLLAGPAAALAERLARRGRGVIPVLPLRQLARHSQVVARGRGIIPVLPLRQLARHSQVVASAVLCLSLGVGSVVLGAGLLTGVSAAIGAAVHTRLGTDVRVLFPGTDSATTKAVVGVDAVAGLPGITGAAPVLVQPASAGEEKAGFIARAGTALPGALRAAKAPGPTSGSTITVSGDKPDPVRSYDEMGNPILDPTIPPPLIEVTPWFMTDAGVVTRGAVTQVRIDGTTHEITVPVATGEHFVAYDLIQGAGASDWAKVPFEVASSLKASTEGRVALGSETPSVRIVAGDAGPVPAVVTTAFAERLGLKRGSDITVQLSRSSTTAKLTVAAVVPSVPGAGDPSAIGVDLVSLELSVLHDGAIPPAAREVWASAAAPDELAPAVRAAVRSTGATVLTPQAVSDAPILDAANLAIVSGIGVAAVLAVVGFITVSAGGSRPDETLPLRAVGLTRSRQRRVRAVEVLVTGVFAVIIGIIVGVIVAAFIVPVIEGVLV
ncbi:hypothetical protein [Microbacterium gorillae]|uniref:hypothetical protein n=1 Tax=Microbacterium gorillae TaxID=1231063 RepID=UPI00058E0552|nr:hypothetical protein [Microbacterium gorillae]